MTADEQAEHVANLLLGLWTEIKNSPDPEASRRMVLDVVAAVEAQFGPIGVDVDDLLFRLEVGLLNAEQS